MSSPKPPFWTAPTAKPQRLRGTHAALLAAAEDGARVWPYALDGRPYELGDLLLHPRFGLGVVVELVSPGKVTVRFDVGDKLLACGVGG